MKHAESRLLRRRIWEELSSGKSRRDVIREYGVSIYFVERAIKEYGQPTGAARADPGSYPKATTFSIVADLVNTTDPLRVIGKRYSLSHQRVYQVYLSCKEAGIPVKERNRQDATA